MLPRWRSNSDHHALPDHSPGAQASPIPSLAHCVLLPRHRPHRHGCPHPLLRPGDKLKPDYLLFSVAHFTQLPQLQNSLPTQLLSSVQSLQQEALSIRRVHVLLGLLSSCLRSRTKRCAEAAAKPAGPAGRQLQGAAEERAQAEGQAGALLGQRAAQLPHVVPCCCVCLQLRCGAGT